MREFFYLLLKFCYLRLRLAKIIFENRVLRVRRSVLGFYVGYLLFKFTLSYSKKLANHKAMISLAVAYHNLCRYHATLRATPCMAQGITKSIWSIEDLLTATI